MESQATVEKSNLYLYCLFKGMPQGHTPTASLASQQGIDESNSTFVLCYKDLCALVSQVPTDEYNEQTLNRRIQDLAWLIPKASHHEKIVRTVMGVHPVIPIRFGTLYAHRERVLEVLRNGYDEFFAFLDYIRDKEEWGIKVHAEEGAGRKTTETPSDELQQFDKQIASASPGRAYLLKRKREALLREQSVGILNSLSNQIYQQMLSWAVDGRRNKLLSKRATGKESEMLLNAAFLLNRQEVEAFKEKVDALAASYKSDELSFEMSGPWPCYNFCPEFHI